MEKRNFESRLSKKVLNMGFCIAVAIMGMTFAVSCSGNGNSNSSNDDNSTNSSKVDTGEISGHEWVDLGLSVKWATCNVGADSPEEYGDYFAWGETQPKSLYIEEECLTYGKSVSELQSAGIINGEGVLTKSHDAAAANWGASWRMPTKAEVDELVSKCEWEWTEQGGKKGSKVTGPNGNSIFLPAAGYCYVFDFELREELGFYWSSTVDDASNGAYNLNFDNDGGQSMDGNAYSFGFSVRPVSE